MPVTRSKAKEGGTGVEVGSKRSGEPKEKSPGKRAKVKQPNNISRSKAKPEEKSRSGEIYVKKEEANHDEAVKGETNEVAKQHDKRESGQKDGVSLDSPDQKNIPEEPKNGTKMGGDKAEEFHKQHGILERGHIYFFYRPKVGVEETHDIDDVARFHFLLVPRSAKSEFENGGEKERTSTASSPSPQDAPKQYFRHIAVGKKRLPETHGKHEVFWATVIETGDDLDALEKRLDEEVYQTKTKGERHVQPARTAGRGVYTIYSPMDASLPPSKRDRTYLAYHLSHPSPLGEVQSELGINPSSAFLLQVKNPDKPSALQAGVKPDKRAHYPEEAKHEVFEQGVASRKFMPANPPALLDYKGTELLLIGDKDEIDEVIGEYGAKDLQRAAGEDTKGLCAEDVMQELLLDAERFPSEALEGKWI